MPNMEKVKQVLTDNFGPASAKQVDIWLGSGMSETEVVKKARQKLAGLLGEEKAKALDGV